MDISIKITEAFEAEELSKIQKAAFKPLYEKYHDKGNPYLRGSEDILCRLNKNYRYFTVLADGNLVGGIFYRLYGKKSPTEYIEKEEYYLCRVYISPEHQSCGIASKAIALCEREFPDAKAFFVDFPKDMEKNRRCYTKAGYANTGEEIVVDGAPMLSVYKRAVAEPSPEDVTLPMIFEVERVELKEVHNVIHKSFETVAKEFNLTKENCPKHTSFMPLSFLETQIEWGWKMYGLYAGKKIIGYMSLSKADEESYELHNLCVLPEYRHKEFGKMLLDFAKDKVIELGGNRIKIGIIEESARLKEWYILNGFVHIGTKKYDHLPFTSGYLEWRK